MKKEKTNEIKKKAQLYTREASLAASRHSVLCNQDVRSQRSHYVGVGLPLSKS
jgi:hypothetical protein